MRVKEKNLQYKMVQESLLYVAGIRGLFSAVKKNKNPSQDKLIFLYLVYVGYDR